MENINIFEINDEQERMQLIRSLMHRKDFLDSVNPQKWDDTDREGKLDDCRAAVVRLIRKAKLVKIKTDNI